MYTTCAYLLYQHVSPHWKFVLHCCEKCPRIDIQIHDSDRQPSNTCTTLRFHLQMFSLCTFHVLIPSDYKSYMFCYKIPKTAPSTKLYPRKYLVMMEISISKCFTRFYIPTIQKLAFHVPHVIIIGTHHYVKTRREEFQHRESFQDVLYCRDCV